jgi:hypothetical protein
MRSPPEAMPLPNRGVLSAAPCIILAGEITDGFTFSNTRMLKYTALENFVIQLNDLKFSTMELN